jgi:hypothetical protein
MLGEPFAKEELDLEHRRDGAVSVLIRARYPTRDDRLLRRSFQRCRRAPKAGALFGPQSLVNDIMNAPNRLGRSLKRVRPKPV